MGVLRTSFRGLTSYCVIALGVLLLLPAQDIMRAGLLSRVKHFIAYAGSAIIAMDGYRQRRDTAPVVGSFRIYAGFLEYLRHFSPGRRLSISDVAVSALEAFFGGLAVARLARGVLKGARSEIA